MYRYVSPGACRSRNHCGGDLRLNEAEYSVAHDFNVLLEIECYMGLLFNRFVVG
jgi:hypothetical protein